MTPCQSQRCKQTIKTDLFFSLIALNLGMLRNKFSTDVPLIQSVMISSGKHCSTADDFILLMMFSFPPLICEEFIHYKKPINIL
jgi:hypothetical protein